MVLLVVSYVSAIVERLERTSSWANSMSRVVCSCSWGRTNLEPRLNTLKMSRRRVQNARRPNFKTPFVSDFHIEFRSLKTSWNAFQMFQQQELFSPQKKLPSSSMSFSPQTIIKSPRSPSCCLVSAMSFKQFINCSKDKDPMAVARLPKMASAAADVRARPSSSLHPPRSNSSWERRWQWCSLHIS